VFVTPVVAGDLVYTASCNGSVYAFGREAVAIPRTRELTARVHSIKKTPTDAGYARFDTEKNERHHADKFWALVLAVHAAGLGKEHGRARQKVSASIV
jgi:phage FluMu gp28-like protein